MIVDSGVISLNNIFLPAMASVTLSWIKNLLGLYLINFQDSVLYCNITVSECLRKMEKLNVFNDLDATKKL